MRVVVRRPEGEQGLERSGGRNSGWGGISALARAPGCVWSTFPRQVLWIDEGERGFWERRGGGRESEGFFVGWSRLREENR